jgi:hypothetical protein
MGLPMLPLHNCTLVSTSAAIKATDARVYAILLVPAAAAGLLKLSNDATGAGAAVVSSQVVASGSGHFIDFTPLGGVEFTTALYATISGTGAVAFIWWD